MPPIQDTVTAGEFKDILKNSDLEVIDVRTFPEFSQKRLNRASRLIPLQELPLRLHEIDTNKRVFTLCTKGMRSAQARNFLKGRGIEAVSIEGGIDGLQESGIDVIEGSSSKKISLDAQTRIVIGAMILSGLLIPGLNWIPWVVGAMLIFAGISGNCMMMNLLAKLPFNQNK